MHAQLKWCEAALLSVKMSDSALKDKLMSCSIDAYQKSDFSIGHRGAPMQFQSIPKNHIWQRQKGAGILECDVTFTKDKALVCRHSQCDLHQTTDVLFY